MATSNQVEDWLFKKSKNPIKKYSFFELIVWIEYIGKNISLMPALYNYFSSLISLGEFVLITRYF